MGNATFKADRLLQIYVRLQKGEILNKESLAQQYAVTLRSIQRDMDSLRCFLTEQNLPQEIIFDRKARGYRLEQRTSSLLTNSEALAVCKILLESRSMRRDEMLPILDKLVANCVPIHNSKAVAQMLANEKFHYLEPHHNQPVLDGLWELGQAVQNRQLLEITYERMKDPRLATRQIQPVGILFSEFYFYLAAFMVGENREQVYDYQNDLSPTIYRIDRIRSFRVLDEHFEVPYAQRFEEGAFRKRVQFMFGGKLKKVRFCYNGLS